MFFTKLDPREQIKGSRDPLGLVPVWSALGRKVVGNLTTVSNSVRAFTTLILGSYLIQDLEESGKTEESTLDLFLKFEQLCGYARFIYNQDSRLRGIERVKARSTGKIRISAAPDDQILGDQKTYGIWGLFIVPGRASGLLAPRAFRPTPATHEFVEQEYIPRLTPGCGRDARTFARPAASSFDGVAAN